MSGLRRFWTEAGIAPYTDGWAVTLDGKTALTPARAALATAHKRLAAAVAAEWASAPEIVDPRAMPMTGFLNAVVDRVATNHAALAADIARFAGADAICYRADAPAALVQRQTQSWDPVLEWAERRYGLRIARATGVLPVQQPPQTIAGLTAAVSALDAYQLTAALKLSGLFKSLILTLSVVEGDQDAVHAYELSRIDEAFQAEQWGEDADAARRVRRERTEAQETGAFLALLD